jgi:hypothetical protein
MSNAFAVLILIAISNLVGACTTLLATPIDIETMASGMCIACGVVIRHDHNVGVAQDFGIFRAPFWFLVGFAGAIKIAGGEHTDLMQVVAILFAFDDQNWMPVANGLERFGQPI